MSSNAQSNMIEHVNNLGSITKKLDSDKMAVNKKPLSFSISRILADTKPTSIPQTKAHCVRDMEEPRVPVHFGTIHHYGAPLYIHQTNYDFAHFESSVRPRACSTPENNEEIPFPTPVYRPHPMVYGHPVPPLNTQLCDSPSEFIYRTQQTEDIKFNVKHIDDPSEKSLDSLGESYQHSPSPLKMKKKKTRTVFTRSQVYQLQSAFDMKRYLSSAERTGLATRLNVSETQLKIWFQNRRNKWKRQINGEMDEIPVPPQFAAGYFASPYCTTSVSPYGRVLDSREELLRSSLTASAYHSHPYAQESRLRASIL